ncbi:hypothetical protein [Thermococcus siculi]|uniref:hypothetical protein n=1 Tax=Thermococcus siculi TaxID=72803 RepID=UPI0012FD1180|nr:hypothetical protein [Thermococcus siculi]
MKPGEILRSIGALLLLVGSVLMAWSVSHTWVGELVGELVPLKAHIVPALVMFLLSLTVSFAVLIFVGNVFPTVVFQFSMFVLPTLWGVRISDLRGYTLGGVAFSVLLILAYYAQATGKGKRTVEMPSSVVLDVLKELKVPILVGLLFTALPLWWSGFGESPSNSLPIPLLLPLAFLGAFAIAAGYSGSSNTPEEAPSLTIAVIRTFMTAGDSFEVEKAENGEGSLTVVLKGGSPSKRPILMTLEFDEPPGMIVLRSAWESRMLFKKYEWIEGGIRYVLYSDSKSRAPSSQDTSSVPPSAPQSLFPSKIA